MKKLFTIISIVSFILMIITLILNFLAIYLLCSIVLLWSLLILLIRWIEPKIKKANEYINTQEFNDYYPDQEF